MAALRAENARLIELLEAQGIEWRAGVCEKPRIKCGDCSHRLLIPLFDAVVYDHLAGEHTVGCTVCGKSRRVMSAGQGAGIDG